MRGSVKNKIRWGTSFLFLLTILSGGVGIYYLVKLRLQSKNVLAANYESVQFAHGMHKSLDSVLAGKRFYLDTLNQNLQKQEANITEPGEQKATAVLRHAFEQLKNGDTASAALIRFHLQQILSLNMQAVQQRSAASEKAAGEAVTVLITAVAVILLVGFTFVFNFPSTLTAPIYKLTEAIKQIGSKNYGHRIHIESKDEFGELANAFNEMAERLEYFESSNLAKILFEKARAEAVINSLKDASIGIDKTGKILFANNQALQLLGASGKDVVGIDAGEVAKRNDLFRFLLEEKGTAPFTIVVDGKENFFTKELIEVGEATGGGKVIVLKNITSFKELDVAKTNFIATVSHELKTPLASSDFSLKLLEDTRVGTLSAGQKELVQNLKADNQRMLRILSELLNLSQVEAGRIQLAVQAVSPYQVVDTSVSAVAAAAKEKGIEVKTVLPQGLPNVQADADKAVWVLNNFLTNAIKYAPGGSTVTVAISQSDGTVSFSVTDTGYGIAEDFLPRLFDRYFQVPGRSDKKGSGIGLAICKDLIEAMDGVVWVESKIGKGSVFGFSLLK